MSMYMELTPDAGVLRVRVSGKFSLQEANDGVVRIFEAILERGIRKVLVDCRQLDGEPTTLERFVHVTFAVSQLDRFTGAGVSRGTRFAYVGNEPLIDRRHFGETVALNRGLNVKVSLSLERALDWLKVEPADAAEQP